MPIQQMLLGAGGGIVEGQWISDNLGNGAGTWTCPAGVTSVSAACMGGGGSGVMAGGGGVPYAGGGGGACAYKNNIAVSPGTTYNLFVGAGAAAQAGGATSNGQDTWFINATTLKAAGGHSRDYTSDADGGAVADCVGDGAYAGGDGAGSGGGLGGEGSTSDGGQGGNYQNTGTGGTGGQAGGGGGASGSTIGGPSAAAGGLGGQLGAFIGAGGAGGAGNYQKGGAGGGGGSLGGAAGGPGGSTFTITNIDAYIGGGGGHKGGGGGAQGALNVVGIYWGSGSPGRVRLIWPGDTRQFPSTNIGDV